MILDLLHFFHLGDVMTDDLAFEVQGSGWFTFDYQFQYRGEQYIRTFMYWNFFYTLINKSNDIISKIPEGVESAEINAAKGQALAIRGYGLLLFNKYVPTNLFFFA